MADEHSYRPSVERQRAVLHHGSAARAIHAESAALDELGEKIKSIATGLWLLKEHPDELKHRVTRERKKAA